MPEPRRRWGPQAGPPPDALVVEMTVVHGSGRIKAGTYRGVMLDIEGGVADAWSTRGDEPRRVDRLIYDEVWLDDREMVLVGHSAASRNRRPEEWRIPHPGLETK